jgi:alpha-methylacyl-CoA racemase
MVDGAALMLTPFFGARASGFWGERGTNHLDTAAHFYEVYETADGGWMAVGAIEPQFYARLVEGLGLAPDDLPPQWDKETWPVGKARIAEIFRTKTRAEWCEIFDRTDACVVPAVSPIEAPDHPHAVARNAFFSLSGVPQPAPAPRFSRTSTAVPEPPTHAGEDTDSVLKAWGFSADEIAALLGTGAVL